MGEVEASETFRSANRRSQVAEGKEQTTGGRQAKKTIHERHIDQKREMVDGRRKIKKLQLHMKVDTAEAGSTENESPPAA